MGPAYRETHKSVAGNLLPDAPFGVSSPQSPPSLRADIRNRVRDVLAYLLRPEELDRWEVRWILTDGVWDLVVDVVASGEPYLGFFAQAGADTHLEEGLDIFTDGLEDFISESRFAWGQQREMKDRPWN